jgi:heat shock protein HslJ
VTLLSAALVACVPMAPAQQPVQQPAQQAAQPAPEEARTVTMIVGPELVDCVGVGPQKCYQVKAQPEDEYRLFYSPIQGFQYEAGYVYQITVRVEPVDNPPADASAYTYMLVEVISKTPSAEAGSAVSETPAPAVAPAIETPETIGTPQAAALGDTSWHVTAYNNGEQTLVSPLEGRAITLLFGVDGIVAGSTGCNNYAATYTVEGDRLAVGSAALTRMMCAEPEGIMEQEAAYLAALSSAAAYRIEGDELTLVDAAGTRRVQARAAQAEAEAAQGQAVQGEPATDEWMAVLKNLEYQSYITESGMAPLENGEYREPTAPGLDEETVVTLTDSVATGDLNGDGAPDAAVVVATNSGGSGVFIDLAAVVVEDGQPVNVAITPLGDRVKINSLTIEDGKIVVEMVTQGPDDPMCCPTQQVVETYVLEGNELVKI